MKQPKGKAELSKELLWQHKCKLCTLDHVHCKTPKMKPTGSKEPLVLVIAEAPGETEDLKGEQLVGPSGQLFRPLIPEKFLPYIRWDNVARCRPPQNRAPTDLEIECCRPYHTEDIEQTKPYAIFGLGNIPLQWALNQTGITKYRGRYFPVKIGTHTAWYFPFIHPSSLLRQRRTSGSGREIESEDEFATRLDIAKAFELVENLPEPVVFTEDDAKYGITCVTGKNKGDLEQVISFLARAETKKYAGIDYETIGLRPYADKADILTIAVSTGSETLAFALHHPQAGWSEAELELIRESYIEFLLSPCHKVAHNAAFEAEWTIKRINFPRDKLRLSAWEDTMVQAFVLDERSGCHSLNFLCQQYFGLDLKAISKLDVKNLAAEPLDNVLLYNGMDAKFATLLFAEQRRRIIKEKLEGVYAMQLRRIPTIVLTQIKGLKIDFETNKKLMQQFQSRLEQIKHDITNSREAKAFKTTVGRDFKPGSTRDVEALLDKILNTRIGKKDTGRYTTDEDVLHKVNKPITNLIIDYRKVTKALSTYIEPFDPENERSVIHDDKLVHTSYNTIFVTSGRLSSDNPNVQNQPKRDSELREIRSQFIPG